MQQVVLRGRSLNVPLESRDREPSSLWRQLGNSAVSISSLQNSSSQFFFFINRGKQASTKISPRRHFFRPLGRVNVLNPVDPSGTYTSCQSPPTGQRTLNRNLLSSQEHTCDMIVASVLIFLLK